MRRFYLEWQIAQAPSGKLIDILQNALTPHPLIPSPKHRRGETKRSFGGVGFLFVIYARGLI